MTASSVTPHERYRPDVRVITDEVDGVVLAVDHVHNTVRHPGLLQQLQQGHAGGGVPLAGLHDVGVAADCRHREHPERDHGGEVEGRDAGTHPQGHAVAGQVHVLADAGQGLPQQQRGVGAQVLNHLEMLISGVVIHNNF